MDSSELARLLLLFIGFGAGSILGVSIGWTQRGKQRELDMNLLAQSILKGCEQREPVKLRKVK